MGGTSVLDPQMAAQTIIRILPLSAVVQAISREGAKWGRYPTRINACPTQVRRWETDIASQPYQFALRGVPTRIAIMGIPVVAGADDAQPELIWASPTTGDE